MSVTGLVARARAVHQRLMVDSCVIARATRGALNTTTGQYATTWATIYSGKCRLRGSTASAANAREVQAGEAEHDANRYALILPYGVDNTVADGDIVTFDPREYSDEYGPSYDDRQRTFTVVGRLKTTTITAASLIVEEVQ